MSSTTALSLSRSRTSSGAFLTPSKSTPGPVTESPGNWQHPRIKEITRRQNATVFNTHNVKTIVYNIGAILIIHLIHLSVARFGPPELQVHPDSRTKQPKLTAAYRNTTQAKPYVYWAFLVAQTLPLLNIGIACLPLVRSKDDLSDIPLTPAQRQLLGLSPSPAPATPESVFSTPPRYARTPSMTGSVSKPSPTSSPLSANDSPASTSRLTASPYSPVASPLLQKALGYSGSLRASSYGPQSPFNTSTSSFNLSTGSSIFSEPPPTPSPIGGKRTSVGLNNKWLYDRSRKSSGNVWP